MKKLRKAAALFLTGLTVLSGTSVPLTANALSVEEAVQAAIAIANDDSHGYSQSDRWGPNYDCSSFVITSLRNAGFDTGDAYGTVNLKHELCRHGFKWYPWSEIKEMANLKRGDILLNESMHTEFYIGRGQDVGAHHDHGNPQSGDQNGQEISISGYYDNPWDGVLRYTNDIPKVKPSDLEIYTSGSSCIAGGTMHFEFFSINSASQKLTISKDGKKVTELDVSNKFSCDVPIKEAGHYTYSFSAKNVVGTTKAPEGKFTAYSDAPKIKDFTANKTMLALGEKVKFTFHTSEAESQSLSISSNSSYDYIDVLGKTEYEFKPSEAGSYYINFSAYNPVGGRYADQIRIVVFDKAPTISNLRTYSSAYSTGSSVTFYFDTLDAMSKVLIVECDGKEIAHADVTDDYSYSMDVNDAGKYTYRLEASNTIGTTKLDGEPFFVYADAPKITNFSAEKPAVALGDTIKLNFSADQATSQWLYISTYDSYDSYDVSDRNSYEYKPSQAGTCYFSFSAYNLIGSTDESLSVTVFDKAPEAVDARTSQSAYASGEPVTFYTETRDSMKTELIVEKDGTEVSRTDVTNNYSTVMAFTEPGVYKYRIEATNPVGKSKLDGEPFTVYGDVPSNLTIRTNKTEYSEGEEILFELGGDNIANVSVEYSSGWNSGSVYKDDDGKYKMTAYNAGEYECCFTATNSFGQTKSGVCKFKVYAEKPESVYVWTENYNYVSGQPIKFRIDSLAKKTTLEVLSDGKKVKEADVSGLSEYSTALDSAGEYTYRIVASNGGEEVSSDESTLYVNEGYTVSFNLGYYYYGDGIPDMIKKYDQDLTLPGEAPQREGYRFLGWSTVYDPNVPQYYMNDNYTANESTTLYAVWKQDDDKRNIRYKVSEWSWDDYGRAQLVMKGEARINNETNDVPQPEDIRLNAEIEQERTEPTCDSDGETKYTAYVDFQGVSYSDVHSVPIPAVGHQYRPTAWKWDGISGAEVTLTCSNDPSHTITLPAETEVEENIGDWYATISITYKAKLDEEEFSYYKRYDAAMFGDVDSDTSVTSSDALEILRMSTGSNIDSRTKFIVSDVDGDHTITSSDALEVLRFSVGSSSNQQLGKYVPTGDY